MLKVFPLFEAEENRPPAEPRLKDYDIILVNSSAGKDSQAMLHRVYQMAAAEGVLDRLHVVHCDLGRMEWQGTRALAERQTKHYGLPFHVVKRAKHDLLEEIRQRGKWPDSQNRYCTSYYKRDQVYKLITALVKDLKLQRQARVLNCLGLRAEESPKRASLVPFRKDTRKGACNGRRHIDIWLPIHGWKLAEVWDCIRASGVEHHFAYDLGMPRLSCIFCVFAPPSALLLAGYHNPELLAEYVGVEKEMQHTFRHKFGLVQIQEQLQAGYIPSKVADEEWQQCA